MQYIWELFDREKHPQVHLKQAETISPYYELAPFFEETIKDGFVEYNGFYRFEKIFLNLYLQLGDDKEVFNILFDVFSRYLILCDLKSGLTQEDLNRKHIVEELEGGFFGEYVAELIFRVEREEKYKLAHYINLARSSGGTSKYLFAKAVTSLLNTGTVYCDKENPQNMILYVGRKKNLHDERIIELAEEVLLPMNMQNKVLWENHFGIIDEESTMRMDEMVLI